MLRTVDGGAAVAAAPASAPAAKAPQPLSFRTALESASAFYETHRRFFFVALIVLTVMSLYGPCRSLYAARRDQYAYASYLAGIDEENAALREDVNRLQSQEGIEDAARERGYVMPGEVSVIVAGLPEESVSEQVEEEKAEVAAVEPVEETIAEPEATLQPPVEREQREDGRTYAQAAAAEAAERGAEHAEAEQAPAGEWYTPFLDAIFGYELPELVTR